MLGEQTAMPDEWTSELTDSCIECGHDILSGEGHHYGCIFAPDEN
jgi:hypothetical protein